MAKKVTNIGVNVLFGILIIISIVMIVIGVRANARKESPTFFGRSFSIVATDSMVPTIKVGDIIVFKDIPFDEIITMVENGETPIIVFRNIYGMQIVHRAIGIENEVEIVTKGDNEEIDFATVTSENFIGIVTNYTRALGLGNLLLNFRNMIFAAVAMILAFILIKQIIKLAKEWAAKEKARNKDVVLDNFDKTKFMEEELKKFKEELLAEIKEEQKD